MALKNLQELIKQVPEEIRIQLHYHLDQLTFNAERRFSGVDQDFLLTEDSRQINAIRTLFALPPEWSNSAKIKELEVQKNNAEILGKSNNEQSTTPLEN